MVIPGTMLTDLCHEAQRQLVLVAPFIKADTLNRLLQSISPDVDVRCVTRWRLDEIATGVSDLEVWPLLRDRPNSSLWLRSDLHAKFYRADEACLVGSANLTNTALGWSRQPNLELLVSSTVTQHELEEFEQNLFAGSAQVDNSLYRQMYAALEHFVAHRLPIIQSIKQSDPEDKCEDSVVSISAWLPTLRHPDRLYTAYVGRYNELTTTSRRSALNDLSALDIPAGLSKEAFESFVGVQLLQMPIVKQVDNLVVKPQRFGAVTTFLSRLPCSATKEFSATDAWQTLMRWLLFFLPTRYKLEVIRYSEIFVRIPSQ